MVCRKEVAGLSRLRQADLLIDEIDTQTAGGKERFQSVVDSGLLYRTPWAPGESHSRD